MAKTVPDRNHAAGRGREPAPRTNPRRRLNVSLRWQVLFCGPTSKRSTGAIRIAAVFPNPGNILRPGGYGKVRAAVRVQEDALLVPQRAVSELQGGYQVAVVDEQNKVGIRTVKVGDRVGTQWIIADGLKRGERVVAEGVQKVRAGMQVNAKPFAVEGKGK